MSRVLPILFNTDMVRAILDGRKTVTRRILKEQPPTGIKAIKVDGIGFYWAFWEDSDKHWLKCPYDVGDILYVRETWCLRYDGEKYFYKVDKNTPREEKKLIDYDHTSWKPSIHMPKEAARIWLKVTDVRVERLQEMSHDAVLKEGIRFYECPDGFTWKSQTDMVNCYTTPMGAIRALWNSTVRQSDLERYAWEANPWVWVIEFERCEKPESEG